MKPFKDLIKDYDCTEEQLAAKAKVKIGTIENYMRINKPSPNVLKALKTFSPIKSVDVAPTAQPQVEEQEDSGDTSSPLLGVIQRPLPLNQYMRKVKLDSGEEITAWCKKDRYNRVGIRVRVELEGSKYYIKEQVR